MNMRLLTLLVALVSAFAFGKNAIAQTQIAQKVEARLTAAVKKIEEACGEEIKKYCSAVTLGEGRLLLCMMAHEDKLTSKCDYALFDASRKLNHALERIEQAAEACWTDIEKHCTNVSEGGGRIAQCLVDKKTSLSKSCKSAMKRFPGAN